MYHVPGWLGMMAGGVDAGGQEVACRHRGFSVQVWSSTLTRTSPSAYTLITVPLLPRA